MLCVTGVHVRDMTNTVFVILHLNLSHLSVFLLIMVSVGSVPSLLVSADLVGSVLGFSGSIT